MPHQPSFGTERGGVWWWYGQPRRLEPVSLAPLSPVTLVVLQNTVCYFTDCLNQGVAIAVIKHYD